MAISTASRKIHILLQPTNITTFYLNLKTFTQHDSSQVPQQRNCNTYSVWRQCACK